MMFLWLTEGLSDFWRGWLCASVLGATLLIIVMLLAGDPSCLR